MSRLKVVELVLSYISIGWAYVMFISPDLFEQNTNWEKLSGILKYEWVLGIILLVCALTKILGIIFNKKRVRWLGLIMSTVLWIVVATGFLIADGTFKFTTGFIVYSGIAVMSLWTSKEVMAGDKLTEQ